MEWKEGYDPAAAPYVTPDAVEAYYQRNGRAPASWTNDVVQAWFTKPGSNHTNSSSTPSMPRSGLPGWPRSSGSNTGAIAGGTVGGVAALALIALLAFFLLGHRRRRGRLAVPPSDPGYRRPELDNNGDNRIPGVTHPLGEMPQREVSTTELPS